MKKFCFFLLVLLAITSCEEDVPSANIRLDIQGFYLDDTVLEQAGLYTSFSHRLSGGIIRFTGEQGTFEFDARKSKLDEYPIKIPVGSYVMELFVESASLYGQPSASFISGKVQVDISELTELVPVNVNANCALVFVSDIGSQLDEGIYFIERHVSGGDYFKSYPMSLDTLSGLYYAYFTPDTNKLNPSAYIWFYEGTPGTANGGFSTHDFEIGHQYLINILE